MEKYAIYCTAEQTKKALELGAPIEFKTLCHYDLQDGKFIPYPDLDIDINGEPILISPTAEQMIGWLEEQGILIDINPIDGLHFYWILRTKELDDGSGKYMWESQYATPEIDSEYDTRKDAILSAIDAALDYLSKNKK